MSRGWLQQIWLLNNRKEKSEQTFAIMISLLWFAYIYFIWSSNLCCLLNMTLVHGWASRQNLRAFLLRPIKDNFFFIKNMCILPSAQMKYRMKAHILMKVCDVVLFSMMLQLNWAGSVMKSLSLVPPKGGSVARSENWLSKNSHL